MKFSRESLHDQSLGKLVKKTFTGEGMKLVKAIGNGRLFCADGGKFVSVVHLTNESLCVNGKDVLALSMSLQYQITMLTGAEMMAGGLYNVKV